MGFDAGTAVEPMAYDFTVYEGGTAGAIPEPSTDQLADLWTGWSELLQSTLGQERADQAERNKLTSEDDPVVRETRLAELSKLAKERGIANVEARRVLLATVCSDKPSVEQLRLLPGRILDKFQDYIFEALNPEASTSATNT